MVEIIVSIRKYKFWLNLIQKSTHSGAFLFLISYIQLYRNPTVDAAIGTACGVGHVVGVEFGGTLFAFVAGVSHFSKTRPAVCAVGGAACGAGEAVGLNKGCTFATLVVDVSYFAYSTPAVCYAIGAACGGGYAFGLYESCAVCAKIVCHIYSCF